MAIAKQGEKTDVEIRKGQHNIKSRREGRREGENSDLEERKRLGSECLDDNKPCRATFGY